LSFSFENIVEVRFQMAEFNTSLDAAKELLEGLTIAEETSHQSGQSVYTNQLTGFLH